MIHLSSSGWMAWRLSAFGGGEYRLYMNRGLPSNSSLIAVSSVSVSSSPDLWISAARQMFFTRTISPPLGPCSLSLLKVSKPLTEKRWFGLR